MYKPIGVKSNTVLYNAAINIQTKPRGRVQIQIPLLVAGPDGTAINTWANT
jgi:hypothetical protein